jgi:chemotaxis protein histidine kinase CheA
MAKKIDSKLEKRIKALGINAKSEDDARKKLVAKLEKEGIEGMEEEDIENLIDMVESFVEDDDDIEENDEVEEVEEESEEEEESDDEEEDIEELADEVEAEEAEESDDEPEDDEDSDDEEEAEESDDEEEEEKPAPKKSTKKSVFKKLASKKSTSSKCSVKLDPKNNEEDRSHFTNLQKMFGENYQFDWLSNHGFTIKYNGKNGKRGIVSIENTTKREDGNITCNMYLLTMKKETDKLDELGIDYELCWTKAPFMKGITLNEATEILNKVFEIITGFASKVDKKLGDNRKKMEDSLKSKKKSKK